MDYSYLPEILKDSHAQKTAKYPDRLIHSDMFFYKKQNAVEYFTARFNPDDQKWIAQRTIQKDSSCTHTALPPDDFLQMIMNLYKFEKIRSMDPEFEKLVVLGDNKNIYYLQKAIQDNGIIFDTQNNRPYLYEYFHHYENILFDYHHIIRVNKKAKPCGFSTSLARVTTGKQENAYTLHAQEIQNDLYNIIQTDYMIDHEKNTITVKYQVKDQQKTFDQAFVMIRNEAYKALKNPPSIALKSIHNAVNISTLIKDKEILLNLNNGTLIKYDHRFTQKGRYYADDLTLIAREREKASIHSLYKRYESVPNKGLYYGLIISEQCLPNNDPILIDCYCANDKITEIFNAATQPKTYKNIPISPILAAQIAKDPLRYQSELGKWCVHKNQLFLLEQRISVI
jgi:hypothetical protein